MRRIEREVVALERMKRKQKKNKNINYQMTYKSNIWAQTRFDNKFRPDRMYGRRTLHFEPFC